jgi:hypothetical protein
MRAIPYASAIGSIMYAMICTHPDISYALSDTSRYQSNYGEAHLDNCKKQSKVLEKNQGSVPCVWR